MGVGGTALIVTPYFKEPRAVLERCIESVARQTVATDHLLVADGHPADWIDDLPVRHVKLDRAHGNFGNTPRAIGMLMGVGEGYAGIGLLDADNWVEDDHVEACLAAASRSAPCDYVVTRRRFFRPDGSPMTIPDEPLEDHVDTSCFFFLEGSFAILPIWGTMPQPVSPVCDRVFYSALKARGARRALTKRVTVNYQVTVRSIFEAIGEPPPPEAKDGPDWPGIQAWIDSLDDEALAVAGKRTGFRLVRTQDRASR
jgi:hypothetical protein